MSNSSFTEKQATELPFSAEAQNWSQEKTGNGTGNMLYILYTVTFYVTRGKHFSPLSTVSDKKKKSYLKS